MHRSPTSWRSLGKTLPVTGTLSLQAHAGGTLGNLTGGGNLTVQGGAIEGQPYHSLAATLSLSGQDINLTKLTLLLEGGTVVGNGDLQPEDEELPGQSGWDQL